MIRRAQAEALLKLTEALEECERNGVVIAGDGADLFCGSVAAPLDRVTGMEVRMAIAKLYPKSEASE